MNNPSQLGQPAATASLQDSDEQSVALSGEAHARALRRIEWIERWLENAIAIPGTKARIGLDALVGLIPVAGDCTTAAMSLYLIWEARRFRLGQKGYWKMLGNVTIDLLVGLLPLVGDYADFTWRANSRNLKIIKEHLHSLHRPEPDPAPLPEPQ